MNDAGLERRPLPQSVPSAGTAIVINPRAGGGLSVSWLDACRTELETLAAGGPIVLAEHAAQLDDAVRRAIDAKCGAIVAGGGDGTINTVASRLVGTDIALGILPLGTLNHFARDLGIPVDRDAALRVATSGHVETVDVGEVNGQYFLNNSSLGLYPDIVRDRERQQARLGRGKWTALAWATIGALRRYPFLTARVAVDGRAFLHRTPFVFIGNNQYEMAGFQIGTRRQLCDGVLSLYVAHKAGRWRLLRLGLRAILGRLQQARDFQVFSAPQFEIETPHRRLRAAIDGELRVLDTPLRYRVHPRALRVIVPAPPDTPP